MRVAFLTDKTLNMKGLFPYKHRNITPPPYYGCERFTCVFFICGTSPKAGKVSIKKCKIPKTRK